jgi:hypothetical protein
MISKVVFQQFPEGAGTVMLVAKGAMVKLARRKDARFIVVFN